MPKIVNAALESRVNAIVSRRAERGAALRPSDTKPKRWYNFVNKDDESDLYIFDEISSWWGIGANDFVNDLAQIDAKRLNLYINSPGGSVFEGYAIYAALIRHSEKKNCEITVIIDGWAASIASVIAMAGDHIKIGAHAQVMIHAPWSLAIGTADDMRAEADVLDDLEETIVDIYEARTGGDRAEIEAWVAAETWFKGQAAVDAGFADEVIPLKTKKTDDDADDKAKPAASHDADYFAAIFPNMPDDVREALTKRSAGPDQKNPPATTRDLARALRDIGYSRDAADSIAAHGFKPKTEPRDGADRVEEPTKTDPRDGAAERDEAVKAIKAFANAAAIKAAALTLNR